MTELSAEQRIAALRAVVAGAQQARSRAEAQRDALAETHRATLARLTERFGVTTVAEARKKLESMNTEIETALAAAEQALAGAGSTA